jgi:hypothetical protein
MIRERDFHRLAGLGAFGACAGLFALFLLMAWASRPTVTGGMDLTLAWVTWIALATTFAGLIAAHVVIGRKLLESAGMVESDPTAPPAPRSS